MVSTFRASVLTVSLLLIASSSSSQTPAPPTGKPMAPGLIKLTGEDEKRAKRLNEQIDAAMSEDRWDGAIARAEELLALRRRVQGPSHFEAVSAEWNIKTLRRVERMGKVDQTAYQSTSTIKNQADNLAERQKFGEAQPLFEKILEIRRRLFGDDHPDSARSYRTLGLILQAQGKYAGAQPLFEKALEIDGRTLGVDHPDTADSYTTLAVNLDARGKYAAAQKLNEKALEIRRRLFGDDDSDTAQSYHNLAANLAGQGKYAAAEPLFEKALSIHRQVFTENHILTAVCYDNLAMNVNAQGKYSQALPLFEKALEIRRRVLTDDHPDTARSYNVLATNFRATGRYAEAERLAEKALEISRRLIGDDHPDTIAVYNNLGVIRDDLGRHAAAQPILEKALALRRRLLTEDSPETAQSYNNLAANLDAQGKYVEAQNYHEKALAIRRRLLTDDHPDTARSYNLLARNLSAQGRYPEARDRWLAAARSQDLARRQVAFTGLERAATQISTQPALAAVLARLGEPADAWDYLEANLGRGLLDELVARQGRGMASADRDRFRKLTAELERLDRLVETTPKGLDQTQRARLFAELKHQHELASIALGEFQTRLMKEYGTLAGQVASLKEIQAALPTDSALVAWVDSAPFGPKAADPSGEHWGVVVRSRGIPTWVRLAATGRDGRWTDADKALMIQIKTALRGRPGARPASMLPLLEKLRAQRLDLLAKALGATPEGLLPVRKLVVLPCRAMAGIPIEALLAPGDTRTVCYAPSATLFKYLHERPRPDRRAGLLALGDPSYERDKEFTPLPGARHEVEAIADLFRASDRPTAALIGTDASEFELDRLANSGELARFGFIHLATHAVIDEGVPQRSAVILTQTALPDPLDQVLNHKPVFDGRLLVREIQRSWDLRAELVTLSACETALGKESGGEGFVGFTQALLMSGARSVCLSLWKVDDKATSLLMTRFYQNMLGKRPGLSRPLPKAEALQEAKQWLRSLTVDQVDGALAALQRGEVRPLVREKGAPARKETPALKSGTIMPYEHPHFWAAFVLVGDPD
jgi:CHAT domain-containing protein/tetratricopeptide (TPR) repeat protein